MICTYGPLLLAYHIPRLALLSNTTLSDIRRPWIGGPWMLELVLSIFVLLECRLCAVAQAIQLHPATTHPTPRSFDLSG
jgi:hypothetical protein